MRKRFFVPIVAMVLLLALGWPTNVYASHWSTIGQHVVLAGETVYCIGRAYGVDPGAIAVHNGLVNPNLVYPGQVLNIPDAYATVAPGPTCAAQFTPSPSPPPACACATHHTVVTGDNLYRISLTYGVSMWRIAECNSIFNLNYIRIGDVLCIPTP